MADIGVICLHVDDITSALLVIFCDGCMMVHCRLLVGSCVHPSPSATDLLRLAWGPESGFRSFNPFLSNKACGQLREGVLVWLQLCVLEDRLQRVMNLAAAGDEYMPLLIKVRCCCPPLVLYKNATTAMPFSWQQVPAWASPALTYENVEKASDGCCACVCRSC
jgi:hypothetical protein